MTIDIIAFPWTKYKELFEQGKLSSDEFLNSPEIDELEDDAPAFSEKVGNSYSMYNAVYEDTASLEYLEFPSKEPFSKFVSTLVNETFDNDLGNQGDIPCIEAVLSPDRVADLAEAATRIDLDEIREAHAKLSSERVDETGEGELKLVCIQLKTDDYVRYIEALMQFVIKINGSGRCLAIHMG